jgi:hypothetical protein
MQIHHMFDLRAGAGSITAIEITATIEADPDDYDNWFVAKIEAYVPSIDGAALTVEQIEIPDDHYLYEPALRDFLKHHTAAIDQLWGCVSANEDDFPNFGEPALPAPAPEAPLPVEQAPQPVGTPVPSPEPVAATHVEPEIDDRDVIARDIEDRLHKALNLTRLTEAFRLSERDLRQLDEPRQSRVELTYTACKAKLKERLPAELVHA